MRTSNDLISHFPNYTVSYHWLEIFLQWSTMLPTFLLVTLPCCVCSTLTLTSLPKVYHNLCYYKHNYLSHMSHYLLHKFFCLDYFATHPSVWAGIWARHNGSHDHTKQGFSWWGRHLVGPVWGIFLNPELDPRGWKVVCLAYVIIKIMHGFLLVYHKSKLLGYKLENNLYYSIY